MVKRSAPTAADPAEPGAAWDALGELVMETMMFHRAWARRQGLTSFQFMVLKTLTEGGPRQPSQIADQFGISRSAVSGEINTLEAGGWVLRAHPKGNRRILLTSPTPRTLKVLESARQEYRAQLRHGLSALPDRERAQFTRTITGLAALLRENRDDAPNVPPKKVH
jgi:DNA-binding MarR family transcriptional regulator